MVSLTDSVRNRQNKTFHELRPVIQELEKASREALNTWKQFTAAMESVGRLYDQYASLIPREGETDELGLDESYGLSSESRKVSKAYKKITTAWVLSDEVVDMRAFLFKEWAVWRRADRHMADVQCQAWERQQQTELINDLRKDIEKLENKKASLLVGSSNDGSQSSSKAAVRSLNSKVSHLQSSVRSRDSTIISKFSSILRKTLSDDHLGPYKTGQMLRNVGQSMERAYRKFDQHEDVSSYTAADVQQTPTLGVPLDIDMAAQMRVLPASQERTEAEYGRGFAYVTQRSPASDVDSGSEYITVAA